jgi:type IV pilus assembly protein PilA
MMRRRKDSGFTLIELMIVIAVIGILAIVLVPRVGTVKSQAKETGLDANIRVVQGYCESKIDKWSLDPNTTATTIQTAIVNAFKFNDPAKRLVNPFTSKSENAVGEGDAVTAPVAGDTLYVSTTTAAGEEAVPGVVYVHVAIVDNIPTITIDGYDVNGKIITDKNVVITP